MYIIIIIIYCIVYYYHSRSAANFSAKIAIFNTSSSLKFKSVSSTYFNISFTILGANRYVHIKYKISKALRRIEMSWSFKD